MLKIKTHIDPSKTEELSKNPTLYQERQKIINYLIDKIQKKFPEMEGSIYTEMNIIDEDDIHNNKDLGYHNISIWEHAPGYNINATNEKLLMTIDIVDNTGRLQAVRSTLQSFERHFWLVEGFVYNCEEMQWTRFYYDAMGSRGEFNEFSTILQINMGELLNKE